jgi:hypothetical protein
VVDVQALMDGAMHLRGGLRGGTHAIEHIPACGIQSIAVSDPVAGRRCAGRDAAAHRRSPRDGIDFVKEQKMRVSRAAETGSEQVGSMREGKLDQKHLLFGEDGSPNNYDLNMGLHGRWRLADPSPPAQLRPDPLRHQGHTPLHRE